jgi:hypothetical protein
MDKVKVEIVEAKVGQCLFKGVERAFIAAFFVPDLAGHEDTRSGQAGCGDAPAHIGFVSVNGGGVNVPVSLFKCCLDGGYGSIAARRLPCAEPQAGNGATVAEFERISGIMHCHPPVP